MHQRKVIFYSSVTLEKFFGRLWPTLADNNQQKVRFGPTDSMGRPMSDEIGHSGGTNLKCIGEIKGSIFIPFPGVRLRGHSRYKTIPWQQNLFIIGMAHQTYKQSTKSTTTTTTSVVSSPTSSHLLCFFENLRFLRNFGSTPFNEGYLFLRGFLIPLRCALTVWLCAVWFFDFAILVVVAVVVCTLCTKYEIIRYGSKYILLYDSYKSI